MSQIIESQKKLLEKADDTLVVEKEKRLTENREAFLQTEQLQNQLQYLSENIEKTYYLGDFKITFYCGENYEHICGLSLIHI